MKVSNAKEWAKKMAVRIGEALVISTVADRLAPTAKVLGTKVLDKFSKLQGRKGIEEIDALAKTSEKEAAKPTGTPATETPPTPTTAGIPTGGSPATTTPGLPARGPVEAKFE